MANQCPKTFIHQLFHSVLVILGLPLIGVFIFYFNYGNNSILKILGGVLLIFSIFLAWLTVYMFRKKGGVGKGESFVKTTKLVNSGIYSIVRHPQYLSGILFGFSLILISQYWLVLILAIPFMIIFYIAALDEDNFCIKEFGGSYREYMKSVPRVNIISGIIRRLFNKQNIY